MGHRKAKTSAGNAGEAGIGQKIVTGDNDSLPDSRLKRNPESRRPTPTNVDFALALAAPDDSAIPARIFSTANERRFRFLFEMRKALPGWLWLAAKEAAGVRRSGISGLSPAEARRLVNAFGQNSGGAR